MAWFGQYLGTTYTGGWWGDVGTTPPADIVVGGGFGGIRRVADRDRRPLDRNALRQMLEAAFADAPRDQVMVEARREHALPTLTSSAPMVDWSSLLADLDACAQVLDRYAERIAAGKTRTQRKEKEREDLRYSSDSLIEMLDSIRAARRARRRRAAAILLLQ